MNTRNPGQHYLRRKHFSENDETGILFSFFLFYLKQQATNYRQLHKTKTKLNCTLVFGTAL